MTKQRALICAIAMVLLLSVRALRAQEHKEEAKPEPPQIVRDTPDALRVEDMTNPELTLRLAEFDAGKRDYRDAYIILSQLWHNFGVKQATNSAEAQTVLRRRDELAQRFPELRNLQDFRLSDRIKYDKGREANVKQQAIVRSKWKPWDKKPLRLLVSGEKAAAIYQYRIAFFNVPSDVKIGMDSSNTEILSRGEERIDPDSLPTKKRWTFKRPFSVFAAKDNKRLLVCTSFVATDYLVLDEEEGRLVGVSRVPWQNREGATDDFCGIVSITGETVYRFPFSQRRPNDLIAPLVISDDGEYAAITIGQEVEGEDGKVVANPRQIWTWESPAKLKKHPGPWKNGTPPDAFKAIDDVRRKFRRKPTP